MFPFFRHKIKFQLSGTITAFFAFALFSSYPIFGKFLLKEVDPFVILILTQLTGGVVMILFIDLMRKISTFKNVSRSDLKWMYVISIFSAVAGPLLYLYGLSATSATNAILISKSEAVITSLFAVFLLKDKISAHQIVGTVIMLLGVTIIATGDFTLGFSFNPGDVLVLLSSLSYALGTILFKKFMNHIPPELIVTLRNLFGASMLLVLSLFMGDFSTTRAFHDMNMVWLLLGLVFFTIILAQILFYKALEMTTATSVSLAGLSSPLIGIFYAMVLLKETLQPPQIIGGVCILIGLIVLEMHFKRVHSEKRQVRRLKMKHIHM